MNLVWQNPKTAPKDGTPILATLFDEDHDGEEHNVIAIVKWDKLAKKWAIEYTDYQCEMCFYHSVAGADRIKGWMHLPNRLED